MIDSFLKYLQFEKRGSKHTVVSYETDLLQFCEYLKLNYETKPADARFPMIRSWIVSLVESGLESTSVNRKIACLRSYFKYLRKQQVIEKDPMMKVRVLKTKKKLPTFVKENELNALLDHVAFTDDFDGWRDKTILELLYGTGIRLSELIGIKDSSIDVRGQTIKVLGKRNKERVIPVSAPLLGIICHYQKVRNAAISKNEAGLLIVTNEGRPAYPVMINRIVKRYLRSYTGSEKTSPHVLRHTYATHLLNKGAEINAVKDLLGHSSLAATQVYTHNSLDKIKKVFKQAHPKA